MLHMLILQVLFLTAEDPLIGTDKVEFYMQLKQHSLPKNKVSEMEKNTDF